MILSVLLVANQARVKYRSNNDVLSMTICFSKRELTIEVKMTL